MRTRVGLRRSTVLFTGTLLGTGAGGRGALPAARRRSRRRRRRGTPRESRRPGLGPRARCAPVMAGRGRAVHAARSRRTARPREHGGRGSTSGAGRSTRRRAAPVRAASPSPPSGGVASRCRATAAAAPAASGRAAATSCAGARDGRRHVAPQHPLRHRDLRPHGGDHRREQPGERRAEHGGVGARDDPARPPGHHTTGLRRPGRQCRRRGDRPTRSSDAPGGPAAHRAPRRPRTAARRPAPRSPGTRSTRRPGRRCPAPRRRRRSGPRAGRPPPRGPGPVTQRSPGAAVSVATAKNGPMPATSASRARTSGTTTTPHPAPRARVPGGTAVRVGAGCPRRHGAYPTDACHAAASRRSLVLRWRYLAHRMRRWWARKPLAALRAVGPVPRPTDAPTKASPD